MTVERRDTIPPPLPESSRNKLPHNEDETEELSDEDMLSVEDQDNATRVLSEKDMMPLEEQTLEADVKSPGTKRFSQAELLGVEETGEALNAHAEELHRAKTKLLPRDEENIEIDVDAGDEKTPIISRDKLVKVGSKVYVLPKEPHTVIASEKEHGGESSVGLKIEVIATRFGHLKADRLSDNEKFNDEIKDLTDFVESSQEAEDQIKKIIEIQSTNREGAPLLRTEAGKIAFARLGIQLFERAPRGFAEKFGVGHQMFTPRLERIQIVKDLAQKSEKGEAEEIEDLLVNGIILPDEVMGVLHELDEENSGELEKKIMDAEVGPLAEVKERIEFIKGYERIRERLSEAVAEEMPELAGFEADRKENERLLNQKTIKTTAIGTGISAPQYLRTYGLNSVYKPALHEPGNENGDGTGGIHFRLSLRRDESLGSEVMAGIVGMLSGMKRVPETILANGPGGVGIRQKWVSGKPASRMFPHWAEPDGIRDNFRDDMEDVVALDIQINNSDRHLNNLNVDIEKQQVLPFDHALSQVDQNMNPKDALADFCAENNRTVDTLTEEERKKYLSAIRNRLRNDDVMCVPQYLIEGDEINPDLAKRLARVKEVIESNGKVSAAVRDMYRHFYKEKGKGDRLMENWQQRLGDLVQNGKFPGVSPIFKVTREAAIVRRIAKLKGMREQGATIDKPVN